MILGGSGSWQPSGSAVVGSVGGTSLGEVMENESSGDPDSREPSAEKWVALCLTSDIVFSLTAGYDLTS